MAKLERKRKNRPALPDWVGNLPFSPDKKRPAIIKPDMEVSTIYGNPPHQIRVQKYISTDKLTCGDFVVPVGGYFDPPDIHPGDEFYYLLEGTATVFNPKTGAAYQVKKDEGFLIPGGVWHQVFNFGEENVKILGTIAPAIWSNKERGSEIEYLEKSKFYIPDTEKIKSWPQKEPYYSESGMVHIKPDNSLHLIHGTKYHVLISLLVNTNRMQVGKITIHDNLFSEPEVHDGDEMVYALHNKLVIKINERKTGNKSVSRRSYEIEQGGKFLIPEGVEHQYFNFNKDITVALFSVAPGNV